MTDSDAGGGSPMGRDGAGVHRIPRLLHLTFPGVVLPERFAPGVERLRAMNPAWDIRLYNDADIERFIAAEYDAAMLATYRSISPLYGAARADLFRYLVVYRCGGVYLDIKSSADRPLDDIILPEETFIISQWDNKPGEEHDNWGNHSLLDGFPGGEFETWFIVAEPRHPFLRAVIDRVTQNIRSYRPLRDGVGFAVVRVTGPIPYTKAIAPLLDQYPHRRVRDHRSLGFLYTTLSIRGHRAILGSHYTQFTAPIVDQPRSLPALWALAAVLEAKALRRRLLNFDH